MTKSELIGELDLIIDHATALYGEISDNEKVKVIIEISVNARRRMNTESFDEAE